MGCCTITGSVSLEVIKYNTKILLEFELFAGNDCVKNEFVEDVRIPTTYGHSLLKNVKRRIDSSECPLSPFDP